VEPANGASGRKFPHEDASPCDALIVSPEQKIPELQ
jgi:hypothetical protein